MRFFEKKKIGVIGCLIALILCLVMGFTFLSPTRSVAEETTQTQKTIGRYVDVTSTESTSTTAFGQYGRQILPAAYSTTALARSYVMHVPDDLVGSATITSTSGTATSVKMKSNYIRDLGFRLIHYKANEDVNKVIYPLDGGWCKYSYSYTYFMNEGGLESITVEAGDKLYFTFLAFASGGYRETYLRLSLNIAYNGTTSQWISINNSATNECNHVGVLAADATTTTSEHYGGTYTYGELLTYELSTISDNYISKNATMTSDGMGDTHSACTGSPSFAATESGESYVSLSAWSGIETVTPTLDYNLDITFRRSSGSMGVYFNCDSNYTQTQGEGYVLHFYNGGSILYNEPISSNWFSTDTDVWKKNSEYNDGEWHTLTIRSLLNKFTISIDGKPMAPNTVYDSTYYADGVYTATENFGKGYIRLVGSGFDVKNFDLTYFDYSDEVANAQLDSLGTLGTAYAGMTEAKYDAKCWEIVKNTVDNGEFSLLNASDTATVASVLENTLTALQEVPFDEEDLPAGEIVIGYYLEGNGYNGLYSLTTDLSDTNITSITEVYAKLDMVKGASVKLSEYSGLRFSSQIKTKFIENFDALGIEYGFGTLIAKAEDITVDGEVDYTLLTVEQDDLKKLDIKSTVTETVKEYTQINGALIGIKQNHYDWEFAGRSYLEVAYADGTMGIFYANPLENVRSVSEVAHKAYNDFSETKTEIYTNSTEYGYSRYTPTQRDMMELFFNDGVALGEKKVNPDAQTTTVHLLDVNSNYDGNGGNGSANCFLIQHNDTVILIDGGWNTEESKTRIINYMQSLDIQRIDYMVLTHAHGDHAGGLPDIIDTFDVGTLYLKAIDWEYNEVPTAKAFHESVLNAGLSKINSDGIAVEVVEPNEEGMRVTLDENTYFEVYNCTTIHESSSTTSRDYNYYSMEVLFVSDTAKAFLAGDAAKLADQFVVGKVGTVDVFTMQHHGSHGGGTGAYNSSELLAELQPTYSVATGPANSMPAASARTVCELYGQVMNTGSDGHLVFDKTTNEKGETHFVVRGRNEADYADYQKVKITETVVAPVEGASAIYCDNCKFASPRYVKGGTNSYAAYVLTIPENYPNVSTITCGFGESYAYKSSSSATTSYAGMRIILNDTVVYPADGGWADLTDSYTGNKFYYNARIKVKGGDRVYFVFDSTATLEAPLGMRIDQHYFSVADVDHVNAANSELSATKNFFNGALYNGAVYTRAELMTYASVVIEDVENTKEVETATLNAYAKNEAVLPTIIALEVDTQFGKERNTTGGN